MPRGQFSRWWSFYQTITWTMFIKAYAVTDRWCFLHWCGYKLDIILYTKNSLRPLPKKELKRRTCFEPLGLKLWYFLIFLIDVGINQTYLCQRFDIARWRLRLGHGWVWHPPRYNKTAIDGIRTSFLGFSSTGHTCYSCFNTVMWFKGVCMCHSEARLVNML